MSDNEDDRQEGDQPQEEEEAAAAPEEAAAEQEEENGDKMEEDAPAEQQEEQASAEEDEEEGKEEDEEEDVAAIARKKAESSKKKAEKEAAAAEEEDGAEEEEEDEEGLAKEAAEGRRKARLACGKKNVTPKVVDETTYEADLAHWGKKNTAFPNAKTIQDLSGASSPNRIVSWWMPRLTLGRLLRMSAKSDIREYDCGEVWDAAGYPWLVLPAGAVPEELRTQARNFSEADQVKEFNRLTSGLSKNSDAVKLAPDQWRLVTVPLDKSKKLAFFTSAMESKKTPEELNSLEDRVPLRFRINRLKNLIRSRSSRKKDDSAASTTEADPTPPKKQPSQKATKSGGGGKGKEAGLAAADVTRETKRTAEKSAAAALAPGLAANKTSDPADAISKTNDLHAMATEAIARTRERLQGVVDDDKAKYVQTLLASFRCAALDGESTPVDDLVAYLLRDASNLQGALPAVSKWAEQQLSNSLASARKSPDLPASQSLLASLSPTKKLLEETGKAKAAELAGYTRAFTYVYPAVVAALRRLKPLEQEWARQYEEMIKVQTRATNEFERVTQEAFADSRAAHEECSRLREELEKLRAEHSRCKAAAPAPEPSPAATAKGQKRAREEEPAATPPPKAKKSGKEATPATPVANGKPKTPAPKQQQPKAASPAPKAKAKPVAPAPASEDVMDVEPPPDV